MLGLIWALVIPCQALTGQEAAPTQIDFHDIPPGTEVSLDGSWIGTATESGHFQIRGLLPGTYQFSFQQEGRLIHSCSVTVVAGQLVSLSVAPAPAPARNNIPAPLQREPAPSKAEASAPAPAPKNSPAPTRREITPPKVERVAPVPPPAAAPQPAPPPQAKAKATAPPPAPRPAATAVFPIDERLVLFPLLAVMLVLGSLLAVRFFARRPAPSEEAPAATAPPAAAEPEELVLPPEDPSNPEPAFLEDLRFRESLFQKGFSKPKRVSNRDIVVDIDTYEVGKEL